jgi:hypothetical protein
MILSEDDDSEARSMKGVMKKCSQNCSSQEKLAVSEEAEELDVLSNGDNEHQVELLDSMEEWGM